MSRSGIFKSFQVFPNHKKIRSYLDKIVAKSKALIMNVLITRIESKIDEVAVSPADCCSFSAMSAIVSPKETYSIGGWLLLISIFKNTIENVCLYSRIQKLQYEIRRITKFFFRIELKKIWKISVYYFHSIHSCVVLATQPNVFEKPQRTTFHTYVHVYIWFLR